MLKDLNIQVPDTNSRDRVPRAAIQAVVDHIAENFTPEKIILFGSYAYGEPKPWSDVDLLVVKETPNPKQLQMDISSSFLHPFGVDILVRTPQEIAQRIASGDLFLREIVFNGEVLYKRTEASFYDEAIASKKMSLKDYALEWVQKAESDFVAGTELLNLKIETVADAICFHCQQCAEKYAKADLIQQRVEFRRTHDLLELLTLCLKQNDDFRKILKEMRTLNHYSVETRYPGRFTSLEEAHSAVEAMNAVRAFIRQKLDL